jgi:trimethylamine:corrinoid methyltransferase-like protein
MNRDPYETWRALGSRDLAARADERVAELLGSYTAPDDLDALTLRQLEEYCLA